MRDSFHFHCEEITLWSVCKILSLYLQSKRVTNQWKWYLYVRTYIRYYSLNSNFKFKLFYITWFWSQLIPKVGVWVPDPKDWCVVWPLQGFGGWMNPDWGWFFCWCSKLDWGGKWGVCTGLNEFLVVVVGGPMQAWLLGDSDEDEANGEVAILLSEVDMLENIVKASGKFGGVAGVFAGVIN